MLSEHSINSSSDVTLEDLLKHKSVSLPKLQITPDVSTAQHKHVSSRLLIRSPATTLQLGIEFKLSLHF